MRLKSICTSDYEGGGITGGGRGRGKRIRKATMTTITC
jgi:hypothetical protein